MDKLQQAMKEVNEVLKKHDVIGMIYLADGETRGEFRYHLTDASWAKLEWEKVVNTKETGILSYANEAVGIRLKAKREESKDLNRTINAVYVLKGMMPQGHLILNDIIRVIETNFEVIKGKGEYKKDAT